MYLYRLTIINIMPDLFENISGSMGETSPPTVDRSAKTLANAKPSTSITSEEVSKDRGSKPCKDCLIF